MSTETDLSGAFALLERQADAYAGSLDRPPGIRPTEPPDVAQAVVGSAGAHRHRRRWPRVAMAAAAIAALAVGVTLVRSWADGGGSQPGGTATATLPVQSLPFALAPQLDAHVQTVTAAGTGTDVSFTTGGRVFTLDVWPSGVRPYTTMPGLDPVTINGRPGFYADGTKPTVSYPPHGGSPQRTVFSVVAVIWEYAPGATAQLKPGPSTRIIPPSNAPSRETLLQVAADIDFQHSTPIKVPFVLAQAPSGMALSSVQVEHHTNGGWHLQVFYAPDSDGDKIRITAASPSWSISSTRGDHFLINQQPAVWIEDQTAVEVAAGKGAGFRIDDTPPSSQQPPTLTRDQLVAIATNVAFDPSSPDEDTWSPATTALPSH